MANDYTFAFSHNTDDWPSPAFLLEHFKDYFDPCPYKSRFDGLSIPWKSRNYVNPPYSQLRKWCRKAIEEARNGHYSVLLIPVRMETGAVQSLFDYGCGFYFFRRRLVFGDSKGPAPFPSMLVFVRPNPDHVGSCMFYEDPLIFLETGISSLTFYEGLWFKRVIGA